MEAKVIHIGRGDENEIVLKHPSISRRHAQLIFDPDGNAFISDLQSTNGTFVNGHKVSNGHLLSQGDRIELGDRVAVDWQKHQPQNRKPHSEAPLPPVMPKRQNSSVKTIVLASVLGVLVLTTGGIIIFSDDEKSDPPKIDTPSPKQNVSSSNSIAMGTLLNTGKDKLNAYVGHSVTECPSDTILFSKVEPLCYFIIQDGKFLDYKTPKGKIEPVTPPQNSPITPRTNQALIQVRDTAERVIKTRPKTKTYEVHTIKEGETLSSIVALYVSKDCSTSKQKIMDSNGMDNETDFKVGDPLYIPCK